MTCEAVSVCPAITVTFGLSMQMSGACLDADAKVKPSAEAKATKWIELNDAILPGIILIVFENLCGNAVK